MIKTWAWVRDAVIDVDADTNTVNWH